MQNKFAAITMIMIVMIGTIGFAAATTYDSSVTLENKDGNPNWNTVPDSISALIEYNSVGEEFVWYANGTATLPNTSYSLIYYADYPDRFNQYGGNNPGALIGTMMTDANCDFENMGSVELNMNLPSDPDANMNISEHNYCGAPDNYTTCTGAKIWMLPSAYYNANAKKVTTWTMANFMFETDLITYEDCGPGINADPDTATFYIGDGFNDDTIPIMVLNATNAGSVDMTLTYNASLVSVTGVTNGDMDAMFKNIGVGQIRIGVYQTDNPGLNGDFTLANVSFAKIGDGVCDFNITVTTYKDATPCGRTMPYDVSEGKYSTYLNGDVNGDGMVDMFDAMYLAKNVLGISGFENMIDQAADVDDSGNVDIADASYLAKHILGIVGYETLK